MSKHISIKDIQNLIITCSSCLALLTLAAGTFYRIIHGDISAEHLGKIESFSLGSGI